jgi:large subunit ribosomal protein L29
MKAEEIRELANDELTARIAQLEEERFRLRFRSASEALEEPLRLRTLRRDIARLQTVARERALGIVRTTTNASTASTPARGTKKTATKAAAKKPSKARSR